MPLEQQRILVTGGSGFLGSRVVQRLRGRGYKVIASTVEEYDLVRADDARQIVKDVRPDVIIHLAARVGGIGANRAQPGTFFYDNLMMGAQLMEQARQANVKKFIAMGTICCYPKFAPVPFREENLWDGYPEETNAPYGLAKKMLLVQGQAYRAQYGFNSIFLMPVNLYGPGDNFDLETSHVLPALIRKFGEAVETSADEVVVWGSGRPTREFLYVDDCAEAIQLATERYEGAEPVNIGSGFEISIRELAGLVAELTGFQGRLRWDASKPDGQPRRRLDVSRAKEAFGFEAHTDFREGLQRTIEWYRSTYAVAARRVAAAQA